MLPITNPSSSKGKKATDMRTCCLLLLHVLVPAHTQHEHSHSVRRFFCSSVLCRRCSRLESLRATRKRLIAALSPLGAFCPPILPLNPFLRDGKLTWSGDARSALS